MNSKFCKHCNTEHQLTKDYWNRLDGSPRCKAKRKAHHKLVYNSIKQQEVNRKYREADPAGHLERNRVWREKNAEQHRTNTMKWYHAHRERVLANRVGYERKREQVDINFKLGRRVRTRLYHALAQGKSQASAVRDLGCSMDEFRNHLAEQFTDRMTWDNYGTVWEVDHILPLANYELTDRGTLCRLVHYTNMQPMLRSSNRHKSNKEE